jgi:hypothetical protein
MTFGASIGIGRMTNLFFVLSNSLEQIPENFKTKLRSSKITLLEKDPKALVSLFSKNSFWSY